MMGNAFHCILNSRINRQSVHILLQVPVVELLVQIEVGVLADDIQTFFRTAADQIADIHGKLQVQCIFHRVFSGGQCCHFHQPQLCITGDQPLVQFKRQPAAVLCVENHYLVPLCQILQTGQSLDIDIFIVDQIRCHCISSFPFDWFRCYKSLSCTLQNRYRTGSKVYVSSSRKAWAIPHNLCAVLPLTFKRYKKRERPLAFSSLGGAIQI